MNQYIRRKRIHSEKATGQLPRYLFVFFAVFGTTLIWAIKDFGFPQWAIIFIPVSFILIYATLASKVSTFHIREEQIGDNAYYLGFLFTLSSLSYALWKFSDGQSSPEFIIGSFGVALWSTIAGIAIRVYFSQMRQDHNDIEKEARSKIAETANALTSELYQASVAFNNYRRTLQQSMEEAFAETSGAVHSELERSVSIFSEATERMGRQVEGAFSEFGDYSKKLNEISAKTVKSFENLNKKIEKIDSPEDLISAKINNIFSQLDNSTKELSTITESQIGNVTKLAESTSLLLESMKNLNSSTSKIQDHTNIYTEGSKTIEVLNTSLTELSKELKIVIDGVHSLSDEQQKVVENIGEHSNALEEQLQRSRKYTEQTHKALASMTSTLAKKLT